MSDLNPYINYHPNTQSTPKRSNHGPPGVLHSGLAPHWRSQSRISGRIQRIHENGMPLDLFTTVEYKNRHSEVAYEDKTYSLTTFCSPVSFISSTEHLQWTHLHMELPWWRNQQRSGLISLVTISHMFVTRAICEKLFSFTPTFKVC